MRGAREYLERQGKAAMKLADAALVAAVVVAGLGGCSGESEQVRRLKDSPAPLERFQAARWLARHGSDDALSHLIDSLMDEDGAVCWAAFQGLRERTGKTFDYRPGDLEADRLKAAERWRDWWDEAHGGGAAEALQSNETGSGGESETSRGAGDEGLTR